jgi:hypothetical protein
VAEPQWKDLGDRLQTALDKSHHGLGAKNAFRLSLGEEPERRRLAPDKLTESFLGREELIHVRFSFEEAVETRLAWEVDPLARLD